MDYLPHLQVLWDYLQLRQHIPEAAWQAFHALVAMGYTTQLAK